jgi:hypothetical protein
VNVGINPDEFLTVWGKFDNTAAMILALPNGCLAATFDIMAVYRITPVDVVQQSSLCISWNGKVYLNRLAPFGLCSSAGVFGSIADMLVAIYEAHRFGPIRKWVNDFLVVCVPGTTWTETEFMDLTVALSVPWSIPKMRLLAKIQRYIGLNWNLRLQLVSMPPEKVEAMLALVVCWKQGCAPIFRLFPTTGTCSGHAFWTCVCFRTSRTSQMCFGLSRFGLRCRRIGSARSGLHGHGNPIIARTRSTELRRSSAALPYVLTIASSCSADSGLTQPPAAAYASCLTHAVCSPMYLSAPGLASCSSVQPLGHWDR